MGIFDKFRFPRSQTAPVKQPSPRFAPGWLAENQRSAIRALVAGLALSAGGNVYQMHLREKIPATPPEVFAAMIDPDFSVSKVVNMRNLTVDEIEALAAAEVRRFVYRLRRIADSGQVNENIGLLYCSVTGNAATKANMLFSRGATPELVAKGHKRILSEKGVRAGMRPGEKAKEDGMWITATWDEEVDQGVRRTTVQQTAEFRVQRFKDISSQIRNCNPTGTLITDFEMMGTD